MPEKQWTLFVRLTEAQHADLAERADRKGQTVAEFVRRRLWPADRKGKS